MPKTLKERDWRLLLGRIDDGKCTPFLGAGVCGKSLPLGCEIAQRWAEEFDFPLVDCRDLVRVAQFLAVEIDPMFPKDEIVRLFSGAEPPDFSGPNEPHGVLADLPLPLYMTTNYDNFMFQALKSRNRDVKRDLCRWNDLIDGPSVLESGFEPTIANPVSFHLHGHTDVPESIVLTEDDYLGFLVRISGSQNPLPHHIERAFTNTSLLFIGYSLEDWDFRVIFHGLVTTRNPSLRRISVAVQLDPVLLFSVISGYQNDLDNGIVSADLRQEFESHEIPLSQNTTILIEGDTGWLITDADNDKEYHITKKENELNIQGPIQRKMQEYLDKYFGEMKIKVFWGTASDFAAELGRRWREYSDGK